MADAIVIAEVDEFLPQREDLSPYGDGVQFRTVEVLKGYPDNVFIGWGWENEAERSDPLDLSRAHPESYSGPCNRISFQKDRLYVLFLGADGSGGELRPFGYPFARVNEDVTDVDAFWVRVIRLYLNIQDNYDPMGQIERLRTLADEIRTKDKTPENSALLLDIETHLATMSPRKPTQYLVETYRALAEPEDSRPIVLRNEPHWDESRTERLAALVMKKPATVSDAEAEKQRMTILWSLANGDHADAIGLFDELLRQGDAKYVPPAMAYLRNHGQLERAKRIAFEKTDAILSSENGDIIRDLIGALPLDKMPLDYRVALYWRLRELSFGYDFVISQEERVELPRSDYRANGKLTIALATAFDELVVRWALKELERRNTPELEWLPVLVVLNSSRDEARERVSGLFCDGGHRREFVIQGLIDLDRFDVDQWIVRIGRFDGLTNHEREVFSEVLGARAQRIEAARERGVGGTTVMYNEDSQYLERFLTGKKLEVPSWMHDFTPVICH